MAGSNWEAVSGSLQASRWFLSSAPPPGANAARRHLAPFPSRPDTSSKLACWRPLVLNFEGHHSHCEGQCLFFCFLFRFAAKVLFLAACSASLGLFFAFSGASFCCLAVLLCFLAVFLICLRTFVACWRPCFTVWLGPCFDFAKAIFCELGYVLLFLGGHLLLFGGLVLLFDVFCLLFEGLFACSPVVWQPSVCNLLKAFLAREIWRRFYGEVQSLLCL